MSEQLPRVKGVGNDVVRRRVHRLHEPVPPGLGPEVEPKLPKGVHKLWRLPHSTVTATPAATASTS